MLSLSDQKMSTFFPQPQIINPRPDLELTLFKCQEIVVQLANITPGAIFEPHQHPENQMGMIFTGLVEINVNGEKSVLEPFQQVYIAGTNIPHGSVILSQETVLGVEIKYLIDSESNHYIDEAILNLQPGIDETTGFSGKFGTCSWFEIAIIEIPAQGKLPQRTSNKKEIGIILNGQMKMKVGEEEKLLEYGIIYYVPPGVDHSGYSTSEQPISLIKVALISDT